MGWIERLVLEARKMGPAAGPPRILTDEELEAPIDPEVDNTAEQWGDEGAGSAGDGAPLVVGYTVVRAVARGGQGTVYEARQDLTGRRVAMKVTHDDALAGSRLRARFDREVRALASIDHPNVISVLDRGRTAGGSFFLVIPYVDGPCLDEYVASTYAPGRDDVCPVLGLFARVCEGVQEAHARGFVHRDLKPCNVRVDGRGAPRVLDFGLARDCSTGGTGEGLTLSADLVGTPAYMAPEQANPGAAAVTARADVYALGVLLYQALCGRPPYPVDGPMPETLLHVLRTEPRPPSRVAALRTSPPAASPAALDALVLRALAKDPAARYANAGELGAAIDDWLRGGGPPPGGDRRPPLAGPTARRAWGAWRVTLAWLIAASGLSIACIVAESLWRRPAPPRG